MPPKKDRKEAPPEDTNTRKYRLFASSKRDSSIKVKDLSQPKMEKSSSPSIGPFTKGAHVSGSQFSVVISDSESETEGNEKDFQVDPEASDGLIPGNASTSKQTKIAKDAEHNDDNDMAGSETSLSKASKSENTARCSRGRRSTKLQIANGHAHKVSAFKPLQKRVTEEETQDEAEASKSNGKKGKGREETSVDDETTKGNAVQSKDNVQVFRGMSPEGGESDGEEFYELPELVVKKKASKGSGSPETSSNKAVKKRKASEIDEEDNVVNSAVRSFASTFRDGSASIDPQSSPYITRQEFNETIKRMKEEMKKEMKQFTNKLRLETKRLIRSEVKDEILLSRGG